MALAAIYPAEPEPVADATEAARTALESPASGPRFSELLAGATRVAVVIDNQFRPTPASKLLPPVLDALEAAGIEDAVVVCANGKVFPMSESDIEQKVGRDNLARMERLGIPFLQNEPRNAEMYTYVGVSSRGTPVWLMTAGESPLFQISCGVPLPGGYATTWSLPEVGSSRRFRTVPSGRARK